MSSRKKRTVTILLVIAVSLISTMLTAIFSFRYYRNSQFQMLEGLCGIFVQTQVADRDAMLEAIKENKNTIRQAGENAAEDESRAADKGFLTDFGYQPSDFTGSSQKTGILIAILCFLFGIALFLAVFWYRHRKECERMQGLTQYLEKVNTGGQELLLEAEDDDYSRLQDEIYKTVTTLYQTREAALAAKRNFADNLYNIAHQLKTPITAISLSAQMLEETAALEYAKQILKQTARLTCLEEALLLLSRIDSGTLTLKREKTDVFTLLTLAADNLQELFAQAKVSVTIQESQGGENHREERNPAESSAIEIEVDREWTMEALMNLLKNCMEHSREGEAVHCTYEQNPLYTQIRIRDEGEGFEKEDIPHLFERFYRGKNAALGGIGIGLSLAKEIIEMQNGVISAENLPEGGACFEIRFYCH